MILRTRTSRPVSALALVLALAACGGDDAGTGGADVPAEPAEPTMDPSMPGMDMGS